MRSKRTVKKESNFRKKAVSIGLHLGFIALIGLSFFPMAKVYFDHLPPMGGDFYQGSTYLSYYERFFNWPHLAWKYIWYNGVPALFDYPWLHMFLSAPLIKFFTSVEANKIYSLLTLFLYFVFSYLLFYKLSKNKIFSAFLSSVLIWSKSTYVALYFAGATAFAANLMLAPLVFYFLLKYFEGHKRKWLFLSGLISGLSVMGHQGMSILFIFIPAVLIIFFRLREDNKFFFSRKFKDMGIYFVSFILAGSLGLYPYILAFLGSFFGFETQLGIQTSSWPRKEALKDLFSYNNLAIYLSIVFVFVFVVFKRKFSSAIKKSLPFISLFLYLFLFEALMFFGKNIFSETLGSERAYWFLPITLGGLIAVFFREIDVQKRKNQKISLGFVMKSVIIVSLAISFISSSNLYFLMKNNTALSRIMIPAQDLMVEPNEENKKEVMPDWLDTDEKNQRLHTTSVVTIWWNALYDLPVTTGYADPQGVKARSFAYWRDTSITSEAVEHFEVPVGIASQDALFLIDWYAIKYLEYSSQAYKPPDYLFNNPEFLENDELMAKATFHFYEAKEEFYSPIIRPTNAPTVLVISSQEAYNSFLRVLAQENLNSKHVIPIHYSKFLDDINKVDLNFFDAVFLYDYRYKKEKNFKSFPEKPWKKLLDYVRAGGSLFIETGSEVKESDVKNLSFSSLPEVFPIKTTARADLGVAWQASMVGQEFFDEVELKDFADLVYQDSAWKLSFSLDEQVKPWAKSVLLQKENPVVVAGNLENGKVVWSGVNLPYHIKSYNNLNEGRFFNNLLGFLIDLEEERAAPFEFKREKSENIQLIAKDFKGILFKENNYGGWQAQAGGKKVKPFEAGTGMMYFPLEVSGQSEVRVLYRGLFVYWLMFIFFLLIIFFTSAYLIFDEKFVNLFRKLFRVERIKKKTRSWWDKDEE